MRRLFFWPIIIISLGLGLWTWQWQATRHLRLRAEALSIQLKAVASDAAAPPAGAVSDHTKAESIGAANNGMDKLMRWQQTNASAFSELSEILHQLRRDGQSDDESIKAALIARMGKLQAMVNGTIESDDAARVMLEAFLKTYPGGNHKNGESHFTGEILAQRLLENQPGALLDLQTTSQLEPRVPAALAKVVETDPAHAESWMRADPQRMTNPDLLKVWLGGLAAHDPVSALAALNDVAALEPSAALAGIPILASHMRTNDERVLLLKHCVAEADVARRTGLVQAVFGKVSTFAEAGDLFSRLDLPGTTGDQIAAEIATRNLTDEPANRGDWLLAQTTAEGRPEALRQFITSWTRADYNAAGQWLGQLPASPDRDTAVANFVSLIRELDPEAAISWAGIVADPTLRQRTLDRLLPEK